MFNRSLVLSLFFVSLLSVTNFDEYIIVVVISVVIHQIVFHVINEQRTNVNKKSKNNANKIISYAGQDDGPLGKLIKKNVFTLGLFVALYTILPSSVVFLRNFHIEHARISFWITWVNGLAIYFGGILFFILRVTLDNKLNALYISGFIYILIFNSIPYILVLYGRLKTRYNDGI